MAVYMAAMARKIAIALVVFVIGALGVFAGFSAASLFEPYRPPTRVGLAPSIAAPETGEREFDSFGRLIFDAAKTQVECPGQSDRVAVLLVAGQSNASNSAEGMFSTKYPWNVVNFFDGKCYAAASPLLGAENEKGEFITPLADALVSSGTFSHVVIVSTGVGGSRASQWSAGGDLGALLSETLTNVAASGYQVTETIWHQGEADFIYDTTGEAYSASFLSFADTVEAAGVTGPIFMSIASRCNAPSLGGIEWTPANQIADAQRALIDGRRILLGVDTDELLTDFDRRDGCHLSDSGQLKVAAALANSIRQAVNH